MSRRTLSSTIAHRPTGRRRSGRLKLALFLIAGIAIIRWLSAGGDTASAPTGVAGGQRLATAVLQIDPRLLDRKPMLDGAGPSSSAPLSAAFAPTQTFATLTAPNGMPASATDVESQALPSIKAAQIVPLPPVRPAELRDPTAPTSRVAGRQRRSRTAASAPIEDNRTFIEKLFGVQASAAPTLAYAALDTKPVEAAPAPRVSATPLPVAPPAAAVGAGVAVYDISARTVTLPNGERLEAHSGLGDKLDDPRHVHLRMRGATPPGTYHLTEREARFHGVRAIRLNPVGGSAAVHGRAGLLAHTYMLGPNGDSNGCVSFRDYDRFLQAYLRGEVRQLVVVAGSGGWGWSSGFASRSTPSGRVALAAAQER